MYIRSNKACIDRRSERLLVYVKAELLTGTEFNLKTLIQKAVTCADISQLDDVFRCHLAPEVLNQVDLTSRADQPEFSTRVHNLQELLERSIRLPGCFISETI